MLGDRVRGQGSAGDLDHGAELVGDLLAGFFDDSRNLTLEDATRLRELVHVAHERDHDLRQRRDPLACHARGGGQDGSGLHLDDIRDHQPQPAAAHPQHRVLLAHRLDRLEQLRLLGELRLQKCVVLDRWRRGRLALTAQELHGALGVLPAQDALQALGEGRRDAIPHRVER